MFADSICILPNALIFLAEYIQSPGTIKQGEHNELYWRFILFSDAKSIMSLSNKKSTHSLRYVA